MTNLENRSYKILACAVASCLALNLSFAYAQQQDASNELIDPIMQEQTDQTTSE